MWYYVWQHHLLACLWAYLAGSIVCLKGPITQLWSIEINVWSFCVHHNNRKQPSLARCIWLSLQTHIQEAPEPKITIHAHPGSTYRTVKECRFPDLMEQCEQGKLLKWSETWMVEKVIVREKQMLDCKGKSNQTIWNCQSYENCNYLVDTKCNHARAQTLFSLVTV